MPCRAAHLRALRCDAEINLDRWYYMTIGDLLGFILDWERVNGKVCGAVGWERQILGAEAEGLS